MYEVSITDWILLHFFIMYRRYHCSLLSIFQFNGTDRNNCLCISIKMSSLMYASWFLVSSAILQTSFIISLFPFQPLFYAAYSIVVLFPKIKKTSLLLKYIDSIYYVFFYPLCARNVTPDFPLAQPF